MARPIAPPSSDPPATGKRWRVVRWRSRTQVFVERIEGLELPMVRIPAGHFWMGSPETELERIDREGPQHRVELAEFLMGQTPITQAQWREVMDSNPSRFDNLPDSDLRPVEKVSWQNAVEFCRRLSHRTGRAYGLPSEAQWEYACRAGTTTAFHFGESILFGLVNGSFGDADANGSKSVGRQQTTAVGSFAANPWGLHDMHGNVWEWCLDHWCGSYEGAPTDGGAWNIQEGLKDFAGSTPSGSGQRVLRGGSWDDRPRYCRSAFRNHDQSTTADRNVGFRVVCHPQGAF